MLTERYDALLLDLDGVLWRGTTAIPDAVEALADARRHGLKTVFVTNNASRTPEEVSDQLNAVGIPAEPGQVVTAAQAGAAYAAQILPAGAKVLGIGGPGVHVALAEVGLTEVTSADDEPLAVVQGFHKSVGWTELSEAALAVQRGATHIATNPDATLPSERGFLLGNGSLVAAVEHATGVKAAMCGKPGREIYEQAVAKIGGGTTLVVGDRLNTDIAGAVAATFDSVHVLTGVNNHVDVATADTPIRPTFLARTLADLASPAPTIESDKGWFTEISTDDGGARHRARLTGEGTAMELETTLEEWWTDLSAYYAVTAAAWNAIDAGTRREDVERALSRVSVVE